jgi:hypothetical protein
VVQRPSTLPPGAPAAGPGGGKAVPAQEPDGVGPDPRDDPGAGRRRYRVACLVGGALALIPHVALLVGGGFFSRSHLGGFYDAQAHSELVVDASFDRRANAVDVRVDERPALSDVLYSAREDDVRVAPGWPGSVEVLPASTTAREGLSG